MDSFSLSSVSSVIILVNGTWLMHAALLPFSLQGAFPEVIFLLIPYPCADCKSSDPRNLQQCTRILHIITNQMMCQSVLDASFHFYGDRF
jgi:hypothetical protein